MNTHNVSQQSPSSQSSPSVSLPESLPETGSGTVSDGNANVSRETSSVPYVVESTDYSAQLSQIEELLKSIDTRMETLVTMYTKQDGGSKVDDMHNALLQVSAVVGYDYPELSKSVEEYAPGTLAGRGVSYYETNNPLPDGITYATLLSLFFACFMGGFLLTSLARVCAFAIRCIKKLFAKV